MNRAPQLGYNVPDRIGFIFREPVASTLGIYQLYHVKHFNHVYTTNETYADRLVKYDGYVNRGFIGYMYENAVCGSVPLYHLYNAQIYDHFYTTSESARAKQLKNGYTSQGIAGYILPSFEVSAS